MNKEIPGKIENIDEDLLYHIVLPRVLPQNKSKNTEEHELALLSRITDAIRGLDKWISPEIVRLFNSFEQTHMTRTPESISNEIKGLQPGRSFAMFVRRQNCGLMIHMPSDQNTKSKTVVVSTFPGNFHPKNIYNAASDFQVKNCFRFPYNFIAFHPVHTVHLSATSNENGIFENDAINRIC